MSREREILEGLAGTLEGDFEMMEVVEEGDAVVLLVKNSVASAIVGVSLSTLLGSGVIRIMSIVVENIELTDETMGKAMVRVNQLNQAAPVGRWVLYPDRRMIQFEEEQVVVEGQEYDEEEVAVFRFLINTIYSTIDHIDDNLLRDLGTGNLASKAKPDWS